MSIRDLMNKQKLLCDDILSVALLVIFIVLAFFFRQIAIMALAVYPLSGLIVYGIIKIYHAFLENKASEIRKFWVVMLGCFYISFALFMLLIIFSEPHIPSYYIVYFISIFLILIGLGGFLKGVIVEIYSGLYRTLNAFIGIFTLVFAMLSFFYADQAFLFYLMSLTILVILNGILRAALYLSEFSLSLRKLSNIKYVFHIMNTYQLKLQFYEEES